MPPGLPGEVGQHGYHLMDIAERIYDAATTPGAWDVTCRSIAACLGAETSLLCIDKGSAVIPIALPGFSLSAQQRYAEYYHKIDPWTVSARRLQRSCGTMYTFLGHEYVPASLFEESEVWQDFSRHHLGAFHLLGSGFRMGNGMEAIFGLHRPRDAVAFELRERRRLDHLLPHLRNALFLAHRLEAAESLAAAGFAALDYLASGIAIIDRQGDVIFANAAMERAAATGAVRMRRGESSGLSGRRPHLSLTRPGDQKCFIDLVERARRFGAGGAMQTGQQEGDRRLLLLAMPLPQALSPYASLGNIIDAARVLVILRDQSHPAALSGDMLKALFGFTEAEAAVATSLCGGRTPEAIADERGVSMATVRTQVRHILEKAGVRSLRELEGILLAP